LEGEQLVPHDSTARSEPVDCPICGRPLKWRADRWLAAFECEQCGEFSDFGGSVLPSQERHHSPTAPLAGEPASEPSPPTSDDDDNSGGTTS